MVLSTKNVFTVEEVAELLGVHPETIRRAIKRKELKAAKIGKAWCISKLDLEGYYQSKGGGKLFAD
jgi:excisionase family DNA binding protein